MKPLPLLFAAVLFFTAAAARAQEFSDEQFCTESKAAEATLNAQGPQWVDKVTRQDGFIVDCAAKSVMYKKYVKLAASDMPQGWENDMQSAWNQYYCANDSIRAAIANGWTVTVDVTLADDTGRDMTVICGQ